MHVHIARLRTRSVRYLESGDGRPLILLHSFPLNADQWTSLLEDVPSGWRFVAPDLSGFGASSTEGEDTLASTIDRHADDVLELMSQLGIDRAAVAGVSMGGYVALAIMSKAATRVTALVLADTRETPDSDEGRAGRDRMIAMVEREGPAGLARDMVPKLVGSTTHRERPDVVATVERLIASTTVPGVRAGLTALKTRPDRTSLVAAITCPTLILCGTEDVLTPPADSEAMHRAITGSRLVLLPRAGHLSNLEDPNAFSRALQEFLT